jgi:hypothetical protein
MMAGRAFIASREDEKHEKGILLERGDPDPRNSEAEIMIFGSCG